ncbi:Titin [Brachionus plicatilis]|uniref:Titin n=1 Tax=Brachionus plicatilis TaxID=10195 RepID=A0A3M7PAC0_BRAPC|nr:Titin [Brachionus plicatilis]
MPISWYKNNAPLVMSARHSTHFDEMKKLCSLKIKNAKPDDAGLYTLVVQNPYGSDQTSGPVSLAVPEERARHSSSVPSSSMTQPMVQKAEPKPEEFRAPRIIKKMQPETTVNEDQAILLSCMIEPGNPLANIVFLKNDKPLNASSRIKTSFNASNGVASIRIEDSNVYDSGTYKIRAENIAGKAETGGVVYINKLAGIDIRPVVDPDAFKYLPQPVHKPVEPAKPKTSHASQPIHRPSYGDQPTEPMTPPNFVVGLPANSKMHEGETIKLSCQVEGNPKPSVIELKKMIGFSRLCGQGFAKLSIKSKSKLGLVIIDH